MCGIVSVVSLEGKPIYLELVGKMNNLQSHRGPDGEGSLIGTDVKTRDKFVRHATQPEKYCCLSRLEGMCAFAIWDGVRGEVFYARGEQLLSPGQ